VWRESRVIPSFAAPRRISRASDRRRDRGTLVYRHTCVAMLSR
jgi:hypothetical protein